MPSESDNQFPIPEFFRIFLIWTSDSQIMLQRLYRGAHCVEFIRMFELMVDELESWSKQATPLTMSDADKQAFSETN